MKYLEAVQKIYTELGELRGLEARLSEVTIHDEKLKAEFTGFMREKIIVGIKGIFLKYGTEIQNTPEQAYINHLLDYYGCTGLGMLNNYIKDLTELTIRSRNTLLSDNIEYVGELVQKTDNDLLKLPNMGRKSFNEIREVLASYGLTLGMKVDYKKPEQPKVD